jgi:hypothetical protein
MTDAIVSTLIELIILPFGELNTDLLGPSPIIFTKGNGVGVGLPVGVLVGV